MNIIAGKFLIVKITLYGLGYLTFLIEILNLYINIHHFKKRHLRV